MILRGLAKQDPADEGVALLALEPLLVRPGAVGQSRRREGHLRRREVLQRRLLRLRLRLRLGGLGGLRCCLWAECLVHERVSFLVPVPGDHETCLPLKFLSASSASSRSFARLSPAFQSLFI